MFTWIIEKKAKILSVNDWEFEVENHFWWDLKIGQSIAHDWACMTITEFNDSSYKFFAMWESLDKTNFTHKKTWDFFNVERCLKVWDRLDGHFVSGHIDATTTITDIYENSDGSWLMTFDLRPEFRKFLIEKWSITINGTSLTISHLEDNSFSVSLIPLTLKETNLWDLTVTDFVNLEFDLLWKFILNKNINV